MLVILRLVGCTRAVVLRNDGITLAEAVACLDPDDDSAIQRPTQYRGSDDSSAERLAPFREVATAVERELEGEVDVEGLGTLFANRIPDCRKLITTYTTVSRSNKLSAGPAMPCP